MPLRARVRLLFRSQRAERRTCRAPGTRQPVQSGRQGRHRDGSASSGTASRNQAHFDENPACAISFSATVVQSALHIKISITLPWDRPRRLLCRRTIPERLRAKGIKRLPVKLRIGRGMGRTVTHRAYTACGPKTSNFPVERIVRTRRQPPRGQRGVSASGGDLCASPVIRDKKAIILPPDRRHHYSGCAVRVGVTGWPPQQTIRADMPVATRLFYESTRRCFHGLLRTAVAKSLTIPPPRIRLAAKPGGCPCVFDTRFQAQQR